MEFLILIITLVILAETTFLVARKYKPLHTNTRKIYGDLIILKSVLKELQLLADSKDSEKRSRARAGLDNASELERVIEVNTEIYDDGEGNKKVDDELLKYAKETKGAVLTLDYNLIKVAAAEKITTLNINDLALSVKTEFLPGEKIKLKIIEKGSNRGQGVGHLQNGTMVVVDRAANKIGKEITVEFVRFHETPAGRIIFAKPAKG